MKIQVMGQRKNLAEAEAIKEIQKLTAEIPSCIFCTYDEDRLKSRPMATHHVDDDGNIWFLSDKNSNQNKEIQSNNTVDLLYGEANEKYLSLNGTASILFDKAKIKELWNPIARMLFKGADDPNISIIKVHVRNGYYSDSNRSKVADMVAGAVSFFTGRCENNNIEGKLVI